MQLMGKEKPIWRLAFFSRLEERKGIKFFVDAISQLDVSNIPNFEVNSGQHLQVIENTKAAVGYVCI